jgi:fatty acid desaturase
MEHRNEEGSGPYLMPAHTNRFLRFSADRRTLAFVTAYFATFLALWFWAPRSLFATWGGAFVLSSLSWFCAVIAHNVVHGPIWHSRTANRATQVAISLAYGFAISDYVPGHNLSHHRYVQTRRDVMRTSKVRFSWNALNLASFFPSVAPDIIRSNGRFLQTKSGSNPAYRHQRTLEVVLVWGVKALFLWLDWRRAIAFVLVPHVWAAVAITSVNYLQHDGCDPDHPYNHSRNFVGRIFNWFHFNNGFHAIHHIEPGMHWSLLPAAHAQRVHPYVHPSLEQKSLAMYLVRSFVSPGRRLRYDGAPVVLPEEGPDEDWMASVPRHPVAGSRSQT